MSKSNWRTRFREQFAAVDGVEDFIAKELRREREESMRFFLGIAKAYYEYHKISPTEFCRQTDDYLKQKEAD